MPDPPVIEGVASQTGLFVFVQDCEHNMGQKFSFLAVSVMSDHNRLDHLENFTVWQSVLVLKAHGTPVPTEDSHTFGIEVITQPAWSLFVGGPGKDDHLLPRGSVQVGCDDPGIGKQLHRAVCTGMSTTTDNGKISLITYRCYLKSSVTVKITANRVSQG